MAKKTLLRIVQRIGEAIGSDEIDTLTETIESIEITNIVEDTFIEVISRRDWEFLRDRALQLDARDVSDTKIMNLKIPPNVTRLQCVKYLDENGNFRELRYWPACDFLTRLQGRNVADDNITAILNDDGVALLIITDQFPTFYTSFDEENITFDAHDATRGVGNLVADSVIVANIIPPMDFTDPTATLPVPERMETLIINEAKATAGVHLRQTTDPRAERIARRQGIKLRELEPQTNRDKPELNYGRRTSSTR